MEPKRLYRSRTDRKIAGVCGGLAEYFNVDPVIVRIVAFILLLPGGLPGLLPYIILWIVVPEEPVAGRPTKS
jgi:phage shock protein PspC (stress-responsive transcriptional regulator)